MATILLKSPAELKIMRRAGRVVAGLLKLLEKEVRPGITTRHLDEAAEEYIRSSGTEPAFKGYYGYPACICTSVNEEVVHGIPGKRVLRDGDIIGVDVGVKLEGFFSDAARTFAVGDVDEESKRLMRVTREAMEAGIRRAVAGNRLGEISAAVQAHAEASGFSVVRQFVGHGIGRNLHEEPQVPNYGRPDQGPTLEIGMALAIEPMVNAGSHEVEILKDGWTVVTRDRRRSGHFEQTVFVGETKAEIVTE